MRFRTFAWTAAVVFVVGVNTGILLWLRVGRSGGAIGAGEAAEFRPRRVPETPVSVRLLSREEASRAAVGAAEAEGGFKVFVCDAGGTPLAGASVRIRAERHGRLDTVPEEVLAIGATAADGVAEFTLVRRVPLRVAVAKAGFASVEFPTARAETTIRLARESVLRVRVLDGSTGSPLPGVPVRLQRMWWRPTDPDGRPPPNRPPSADSRTGELGECEFRGLSGGPYAATALPEDRVPGQASLTIPDGGEADCEVRVRSGDTIRGRIVVPGFSKEVTGGTVSFRGAPSLLFLPPSYDRVAAIGLDGRFVLPGVELGPPGTAVRATLRVETGGQVYVVGVGTPSGELLVQLPGNNPDDSFAGAVTDAAGAPVPGATVVLGTRLLSAAPGWSAGGRDFVVGSTGAAGDYRVHAERRRPNEILVLHPDHAPVLVAIPSRLRNRRFDVTLPRGATAVVTVKDASGRAEGRAEVSARMRHPDPERAWEEFGDVHGVMHAHPLSDSAGRAAIPHLGPGSWYLSARSADGLRGGRVLVESAPGVAAFGAEIVLDPLPTLRGVVRDAAGIPLSDVWVAIPGESAHERIEAPTGRDGRFDFFPAAMVHPVLVQDGHVPLFVPGYRIAGGGEFRMVPLGGEADVDVIPDPAPLHPR